MAEGVCTGGGCQGGACGQIGEACCAAGIGCTEPFSVCQAEKCAPCGGLNERCCGGGGAGGLGGGSCAEPFTCGAGGTCGM
jgi:hypothetical protein